MVKLEYVIKIIVTPVVACLVATFWIIHFFIGSIVYLWLVFRFLIMYSFAVVKSAYLNQNIASQYLELITGLCRNYIQLYIQIGRIVIYIWLPRLHNVTYDIKQILTHERTLLKNNFVVNLVIIAALTMSFYVWTFGLADTISTSIDSLFSNSDEGLLDSVALPVINADTVSLK